MKSVRWTVLYALWALSDQYGVAQITSLHVPLDPACKKLNQTAVAEAENGRIDEAERTLSSALTTGSDVYGPGCTGVTLSNIAAFMNSSGRFAEAEKIAERSIRILEESYPRDDPDLVRPLQSLAVARLGQGKTGRARETVQRMQSIHVERARDRAAVHDAAAWLLCAERRWRDAETEYLASLAAWQEAGLGDTAYEAGVVASLGSVYIEEQRFEDARRAIDRALSILTRAKGTVPLDRMAILATRAMLHVRQREWREAEEDLRNAVSTVDRERCLDPTPLAHLLLNYAYVLRKNHHRREARTIEARAAPLQVGRGRESLLDVSDLVAKQAQKRR